MPQNPFQALSAAAHGPVLDVVALSPAGAVTPRRTLRANGEGTLRLTGLGGTVIDLDVAAGEVIGGRITRAHRSGPTAARLAGCR